MMFVMGGCITESGVFTERYVPTYLCRVFRGRKKKPPGVLAVTRIDSHGEGTHLPEGKDPRYKDKASAR